MKRGDKMKPISVIIVEDDPMVQEINKRFINRMKDFKVVGIASNGEEAFKLVEKLQPQLMLLDIFMTKTNGLEVLREIRKREANIDVILITADKSVDTIHDAIRYGVIDYIIKPFKFERFKEALLHYKNMKEQLLNQENIRQEDLDNILHIKGESTTTRLPKGLNQITLDLVLNYLREHQEFHTSMELAEAVGIARVTARRYLEYLSENKSVMVDLEYGSVGRPIHKYKYQSSKEE
ncbi:MAG: response regulator [Bacillota bacterium]